MHTRDLNGEFLDYWHGYGDACSRWDFHQHKVTQTNLDRGWSGARSLFVMLRKDDNHQATFSLCSLNFPLRELFDTFAEQVGLPVSELCFLYNGVQLSREATPRLYDMKPCDLADAHVIDVRLVSNQLKRQRLFQMLNMMGSVNLAEKPDAKPLCPSNLLSKALLALPLEDLLSSMLVDSCWFHITQRLSLLVQLHHGDFGWASADAYPEWLRNVLGHSAHLAAADVKARQEECQLWRHLNVSKELVDRHVYTFTKAAGCTQMKTVAIDHIPAEFEQQWLQIHTHRTKFMAQVQSRFVDSHSKRHHARQSHGAWSKDWASQLMKELAVKNDENPEASSEQEMPPPGSSGFLTRAHSPQFKALAIELFRKYFSPDMFYIFPLIVYQEAGFGLDFRSTETTLIFGKQELSSPSAPVGACSWRLRRPVLEGHLNAVPDGVSRPKAVLEVLFIAVWEEERQHDYGSRLVEALEARARQEDVKFMYVEIGFEQPKAKCFWGKNNGFQRLQRPDCSHDPDSLEVPQQQIAFFDANCLRFSDTEQYVKCLM